MTDLDTAAAGTVGADLTLARLRFLRRLGLTGALLMATGALGAGALPVPNPLFGVRVLGLPVRNVTTSIAVVYAGMGLLVLAWLAVAWSLHGSRGALPAGVARQLGRTAVTWAVPLMVAPPLFSRDVYSYLAQGIMVVRGLDPSTTGPAEALGIDDPLVRGIPTIWRDTPAPYGPLFLLLARGVAALTGEDVVLGILAHRVLALAGIAAAVWALPRLAARCGIDRGRVLWLGVAHPLVLFHFVSGAHNDALMMGLMLAGLEVGARAGPRILDARFLGGAALIVSASAVKLPALLALGFLGMACARRRGGPRAVAPVAGVLGVVLAAVYAVLSTIDATSWGWLRALGVPGTAVAWMSPTTALGHLAGAIGALAGLGDHTAAVLDLTWGAGIAGAAWACGWLLVATLRGRVEPTAAVAAGLGAAVVLGPLVQPWYVLWAVMPGSAVTDRPRLRRAVLAGSAALALVAVPTGSDFFFRTYQLLSAVAGAVAIVVVALVVVQRERADGATPAAARPNP